MRLLRAILLIAISAGIITWFLPWWYIAACSFVVVVTMNIGAGKGFLAGFSGIALMWLAVILWRDIPNEHILSSKMAVLIFGSSNSVLFVLTTIVLGGLVGGLSGLSAGLMNRSFRK